MRYQGAIVFRLIVAAVCTSSGWSLPAIYAKTKTPTQDEAAGLSGIVVTFGSVHQPVRRAIVSLAGASVPLGRSIITDDQGRFVFERVPAGRFELSATKPGYLRAVYGATRPGRPGVPIELSKAQRIADLTLILANGAAIAGMIRDSGGQPAQGVQVSAIRLPSAGGSAATVASTTNTDDRGQYRIYGLPPGKYIVAASTTVGSVGQLEMLSSSEITAALDLLARPAIGRPPGSTISNIRAVKYVPIFYGGTADASQATAISLDVSGERDGVDVTLELVRALDISGIVTSPDGLLSSTQIGILPQGPQLPTGLGFSMPSTRLEPDGEFRFAGVPPGVYTIQARTVSSGPGAASGSRTTAWARLHVEVIDREVSGLSLRLQPALSLNGHVRFDGTTLSPPSDMTKVTISLISTIRPNTRDFAILSTAAVTTQARSDGSFTVPGLLPGSYQLAAAVPNMRNWVPRSAFIGGIDALDVPFDLEPNGVDASGMIITFSDRQAALSGAVETAQGHAASDYFIILFSEDPAFWSPPSRRVRTTRAGTDGTFSILGLPAGKYCLTAVAELDTDDLLDPQYLSTLLAAAVKLNLTEGEQKVQRFRIALK